MLKELPRHTISREVPHFEHLDFLWGQEVNTLVFPQVFEALTAYAGRDHMKKTELIYRPHQSRRFLGAGLSNRSEDELSSPPYDGSDISPETNSRIHDLPTRKLSANRFSPSTPRNRTCMSPPSSTNRHQWTVQEILRWGPDRNL